MASPQHSGSASNQRETVTKRKRSRSRGSQLKFVRGRNLVAENRSADSDTAQALQPIPPGYKAASHEEYVQKYIVKPDSPLSASDQVETEIAETVTTEDSLHRRLREAVNKPDAATRRQGNFGELANAQRSTPGYINKSASDSRPISTTSPSQTPGTQDPDPVIVARAVRSAMEASSGAPGAFSNKFQTAQQAYTFSEARSFERRPPLAQGEMILPEGARGSWAKLIYDAMTTFNEADRLSLNDWQKGNPPQDYLEAMAVAIIHQTIALYERGPRVWLAFPFDAAGNTNSYEQDLGLAARLTCIKTILLRHKDYVCNILSGVGYQPMIHAPQSKLAQLDRQAQQRREKLVLAYQQRQYQMQPRIQVAGQFLGGLQSSDTENSMTQTGSSLILMPGSSQSDVGNPFPAGAGLASIPDPPPNQDRTNPSMVSWSSHITPHNNFPLDPRLQFVGAGSPRLVAASPRPSGTPHQGWHRGSPNTQSMMHNQHGLLGAGGGAPYNPSPMAPPGYRRVASTYQSPHHPSIPQPAQGSSSEVPQYLQKAGVPAQQHGYHFGGSPRQPASGPQDLTIDDSTEAIMNRYGLEKNPSRATSVAGLPGPHLDKALRNVSESNPNVNVTLPLGAPSMDLRTARPLAQSLQRLDSFEPTVVPATPLPGTAEKTGKRRRHGEPAMESSQDLSANTKRVRLETEQNVAASPVAPPEDSQALEAEGATVGRPASLEPQITVNQMGDDTDPVLWDSWLNQSNFGGGSSQGM